LKKSWVIALTLIEAVFFVFGGYRYGSDVSIIESEMVDTAKWITTHTEPNAVIAAHDIGALGYFGQREIIDLAGLVSPAVIPIIHNEDALIEWLDNHDANYLMTFPDWYIKLTEGREIVYQGKWNLRK